MYLCWLHMQMDSLGDKPLKEPLRERGAEVSASAEDVRREGASTNKPPLNLDEEHNQFKPGEECEGDAPHAVHRASTSLLRGTPEQLNEEFRRIFLSSPRRAAVVSRNLVAHMIKFLEDRVRRVLPDIHRMIQSLATKAGCPFDPRPCHVVQLCAAFYQ